jgi:hypothetical protein
MSFLQGDKGGHFFGPASFAYLKGKRKREGKEFKEKPGFSDTKMLDPDTGQPIKRRKKKYGVKSVFKDVANPLRNFF